MNIYFAYFIYFFVLVIIYLYSRKNNLNVWDSIVLSSIISLTIYLAISPEAELSNLPQGDFRVIINGILNIVTTFIVLFYTFDNILKKMVK